LRPLQMEPYSSDSGNQFKESRYRPIIKQQRSADKVGLSSEPSPAPQVLRFSDPPVSNILKEDDQSDMPVSNQECKNQTSEWQLLMNPPPEERRNTSQTEEDEEMQSDTVPAVFLRQFIGEKKDAIKQVSFVSTVVQVCEDKAAEAQDRKGDGSPKAVTFEGISSPGQIALPSLS
ncbi:MAG: hypothetical protein SGCHY_003876, partial [Lobulomycetales sp.]